MIDVHCVNCHLPLPEEGLPYRCPECGGIFDFVAQLGFDPHLVEPEQPGIWRYRHTFALPTGAPVVTLGEGDTPLVWGETFGHRVAFKCEHLNPTGSFKDRGSSPIVSLLDSKGVSAVVEDSSGNAGSSLAAYSARAGLQARIFMPDTASGPKRNQIEAYGAEIVLVQGPRSNAAEAVQLAVDRGAVYASHAYLPHNMPGYATIAYELVEQLDSPPGTVVLPVGQGGLFLGLGRGFEALQKADRISQMPNLVGVQARACAPLWALFTYGPAGLSWVAEGQTVAEGIRVRHPLRGDALLQMVTDYQGSFLVVDEDEIQLGRQRLARRGLFVELTSAVVWGALDQIVGKVPEPIVIILTGSGLKNAY
jgi:threonine synthase